MRLAITIPAILLMLTSGSGAAALTLQEAILYVLETNPEIEAAEADKQAIEFELEQARNQRAPRFQLEAWGGSSQNQGTATPDLSSARDAITGYELSAQVSQLLFDGYRTRSEIERQAYRIDSAAYRVLERSEVLSLEAVRQYSEVLRCIELLSLAERNLAYHRQVAERLQGGQAAGVIADADIEQAGERLALAEDTVLEFQYNLEDARSLFLAIVGVEAQGLGHVPGIGASVPTSLDAAVAVARRHNPTLLFAQADVGSAEALSRAADANRYPTLHLEAEGRLGEDVGGFEGDRDDARVGLVLRYEFQGNRKRAERQEQIRRVSEAGDDRPSGRAFAAAAQFLRAAVRGRAALAAGCPEHPKRDVPGAGEPGQRPRAGNLRELSPAGGVGRAAEDARDRPARGCDALRRRAPQGPCRGQYRRPAAP